MLRVYCAGSQLNCTLESFTHHQRYLGYIPCFIQNVQDCSPSGFCRLMKLCRQLKKCFYAVCVHVCVCAWVHVHAKNKLKKFIGLKLTLLRNLSKIPK